MRRPPGPRPPAPPLRSRPPSGWSRCPEPNRTELAGEGGALPWSRPRALTSPAVGGSLAPPAPGYTLPPAARTAGPGPLRPAEPTDGHPGLSRPLPSGVPGGCRGQRGPGNWVSQGLGQPGAGTAPSSGSGLHCLLLARLPCAGTGRGQHAPPGLMPSAASAPGAAGPSLRFAISCLDRPWAPGDVGPPWAGAWGWGIVWLLFYPKTEDGGG